ncbi:MAG: radical SAM protein [Candidatus Omnitrophota bacterium]
MPRISKTPYAMRLLLTKRCNLHCTFCLDDAANASPRSGELSTDEWLTFFKRLKELNVFDISLSGGEIFLRDDLFILLKALKENKSHRVTLLTNGILITPEIADELLRIGIKNISISLDGLEDAHDSIRGKNAFQQTLQGIRHLIGVGIFPNISFTATRTNSIDIGPLIDRLAPLGIRSIGINSLAPEGRCLSIYKDIVPRFPEQYKDLLDTIEEKRKSYPAMKIECSLGFHYYLPESYKYFKENPQNFQLKHLKDGCGAACTSCVVTATGDVLPCNGLSTFPGGNIRESDLLDIWENSENFQQIRDLSQLSMEDTPHCKTCKYRYLCDGGCRATSYIIYRDLLAPSVLCPFFDGEKISSAE